MNQWVSEEFLQQIEGQYVNEGRDYRARAEFEYQRVYPHRIAKRPEVRGLVLLDVDRLDDLFAVRDAELRHREKHIGLVFVPAAVDPAHVGEHRRRDRAQTR